MPRADRKSLRTIIKTFLNEQKGFLSRINEVVCENKTLDGLHMDMVNCKMARHAEVRAKHCRTIATQHKLLKEHRRVSELFFQVAEREQSNQMTQEEILLEIERLGGLLDKVRSEQARILKERDSILADHGQIFENITEVPKER